MRGQELLKWKKEYTEREPLLANLSEKTIKNRINALNRFFTFCGEKEFEKRVVEDYFLSLQNLPKPWKPSSIKAEYKVLRAFCQYLVDTDVIAVNFVAKIKPPKVHKVHREFISEQNAEKAIIEGTKVSNTDNFFARYVKQEMLPAMKLILRSGIRISELRALTGDDLHLDDETPHFMVHSKGGNYEPVICPPDMIDELGSRKSKGRLFEVTEDGCNRALRRGCKALGLKMQTVHDLRHIYTLTRLRKGQPLQKVSKTLRHKKVSMTDEYYSHYLIEDLQETAYASDIITEVPIAHQLKKIVDAVDRTGVGKDKRIFLEQTKSNNEILIRAKVKINEQ